MNAKLKDILERAQEWPEKDQAELAEYAQEIESRHGVYYATEEELAAIDEAEKSGIANEEEVREVLAKFGVHET